MLPFHPQRRGLYTSDFSISTIRTEVDAKTTPREKRAMYNHLHNDIENSGVVEKC